MPVAIKLMGGLGNYMFQVGAACTHAARMKTDFFVDARDVLEVHKPISAYTSNMLRKVQFANAFGLPMYHEPKFSYSPLPETKAIKLVGYFQSQHYLEKSIINDLFDFDSLFIPQDQVIHEIESNDSVSLHVRRGDYLKIQDYHPVCSIDYYQKAVNFFGKDKRYFIFSDDIEWCQNFLPVTNATFITGLQDWQEMVLMSRCKNNVIANSTFSWWPAFLNKNNPKVIAPKVWFGEKLSHHDTTELFPNDWIRL